MADSKDRRKFKKCEVAWVARMLGSGHGPALHAMDTLYRKSMAHKSRDGDPAEMTWCVRFFLRGGGRDKGLSLEREAGDTSSLIHRLNPAGGLAAMDRVKVTRFFYREA